MFTATLYGVHSQGAVVEHVGGGGGGEGGGGEGGGGPEYGIQELGCGCQVSELMSLLCG